jgi:hypothetical protein
MYASRGRWASGMRYSAPSAWCSGEAFAVLLADDLMIGDATDHATNDRIVRRAPVQHPGRAGGA